MRIFGLLPAAFMLSGCFHLGAKPMTFTGGEMLAAHIETYDATPLICELQRDTGRNGCPKPADGKPRPGEAGALALDGAPAPASADPIAKALDNWRERRASLLSPQATSDQPGPPVLMLSGGGSWGAFGAGYLTALDRRDWAVVTGVSTGALQGLFVAAGDYPEMVKAYSPEDGREIVKSHGLLGLLFKGSEFDLAPLRGKVLGYLLPADGAESPLLRMLRPDAPDLSVAMVEARSGDLKVVHVTQMVRAALGRAEQRTPAELRRVAECVTGVVLASSAIPVRLTPVQIDGRTYVDGGVRSSVFDAEVGRKLALYAANHPSIPQPNLYVVRNGPTVVFPDADDPKRPGTAAVDVRPDVLRVGLRGYSTIVNQNELMSIASLRLKYPTGPIHVATADGFDAPMNPNAKGCQRQPEMFNPKFMGCLVEWGKYKARSGPGWIELRELKVSLAGKTAISK
jgi:hypothetical protein